MIVTRRLPSAIEAELVARYGAHLNADDHQFSEEELAAALAEHEIVACTLTDRITRAQLLAPGVRTRLLANFGAGTNHIDLAAAAEGGIAVTNTPGVLTDDTADLAMLLMLAVTRRAWEGNAELRAGRWTGWRPTHLLGQRLSGLTLGIVGFGRIGRAVARRACHGFGMRVVYTSRRRSPPEDEAVSGAVWEADLDALVSRVDVVSLHCPATPQTRHLINAARLQRFRPEAFLVNTGRGDLVDERALVDALRAGTLRGAALDVFEHEPVLTPGLLDLPNVVTLPHLGSATVQSRVAMGDCVLQNIRAYLTGAALPHRVV